MNTGNSTTFVAAHATTQITPTRLSRARRCLFVAVLVVVAGLLWEHSIETNAKSVLLISQLLPQIPLKPLDALTNKPAHLHFTISSAHGPIVIDLFRPVPHFGSIGAHSAPAIIFAMGVKAKPSDKKMLLSFTETFSRLGYVVMWPRLATLDQGSPLPETPDTFVSSVLYLRGQKIVDPRRVSIIGLSIGSSMGLIAAADSRIRGDVHVLGWFGGTYDVFDYLVGLATHTSTFDGKTIAWQPDREATSFVKHMLRAEHATAIARIFTARTPAQAWAILRAAPEAELNQLREIDPALHLKDFKADVFILHDQSDHFVSYLESVKLHQALPTDLMKTYLISNLFEHTHPKSGVSLSLLTGAVSLYGLLHDLLGDL